MRRVPATTSAIVCLLGILWFSAGLRIAPIAKRHDFFSFYTGATLVREGNIDRLHVIADEVAVQRRLDPAMPVVIPFVRPPFYAALLTPLALWDLDTAYVVWVFGQILCLAAVAWWGVRRFGPDALILGVMFLPTALGIAHGQDCTFMLLVVVAAYVAAERGHHTLAGALFGITTIKFHLLLLVPITAAVRKQWKFLAGYAATGLVALGSCLMLSGVDGLVRYAQLLTNKDLARLSPSEELMINVNALALNLGFTSKLAPAFLGVVVTVVALVSLRGGRTWRWFGGAIAASLLVTPHVYGYDAALLLLPLWFSVFTAQRRSERMVAVALCTPIPFMFGMVGRPWAFIGPAAVLVYLTVLLRENWRERRILCTTLHFGVQSADGRFVTRSEEGVTAQDSHAPQGTRRFRAGAAWA